MIAAATAERERARAEAEAAAKEAYAEGVDAGTKQMKKEHQKESQHAASTLRRAQAAEKHIEVPCSP